MITQHRVNVGDVVNVTLPWSEVCVSMRVADQTRPVLVLTNGAQILNNDGTPFSFPVTHGEASIYRDAFGLYTLADEKVSA